MEKKRLTIKPAKTVVLDYFGEDFEVVTVLSLPQQIFLIETYLDAYFSTSPENRNIKGSRWDLISAEYALMVGVLDLCTSIQTVDENGEITFNLSEMMSSNLWTSIKHAIVGYDTFRDLLDRIVFDVHKEIEFEYSVGKVVSDFLAKITPIIQRISEFSTQDVGEITKAVSDLEKVVRETPLSPLLAESKKHRKKKVE